MSVLPGMLPVSRRSSYVPLTQYELPRPVGFSNNGWREAPSMALFDNRSKALDLTDSQAFLKPMTPTSFKGLPEELKPIMAQAGEPPLKNTSDYEVRLNHPQIIRAANGDVIFSREEVTKWKKYRAREADGKTVYAMAKTGTHILIFDKDMNFKTYKQYRFSDLGQSDAMSLFADAETAEDMLQAKAALSAKQKGYLTSYFTMDKGKLNKTLNLTEIDRHLTDTRQLAEPEDDDMHRTDDMDVVGED